MEEKRTYKRRTRKEVMAWLQRARERRQAWEEQTLIELKAMAEGTSHTKDSFSIKMAVELEKSRQQLASFYAKQIDEEMDQLWESGQFDEKRMKELRGSHFRTPYNK